MSSVKESLRNLLFNLPFVGPRYKGMYEAAESYYRINPGHYGSPIPSESDIDRESSATVLINDDSLPGIRLRTAAQLDLLSKLCEPLRTQPFCGVGDDKHRYYYENDWFQFTDGLILHGLLRHFRPKRFVEIGSGFSSFVALDTIELNPHWDSKLTMIDPDCRRLRSRLRAGDEASLRLVNSTLQEAPRELFHNLRENDVLFVDSSHVSKSGSDVNLILHEILPNLNPGVLVHFHDIFFPFHYPRRLLDNGQYWNEAYTLRAFLCLNERFEIVLWNDYLKKYHSETLAETLHEIRDDIACSFWMRSV